MIGKSLLTYLIIFHDLELIMTMINRVIWLSSRIRRINRL